MTKIDVVKGVDMPAPLVTGRNPKYPFNQLSVGGMFFIPDKKKNTFATFAGVWGKKLNMTFRTRLCYMVLVDGTWTLAEKTTPGAKLGVGVWRTQ